MMRIFLPGLVAIFLLAGCAREEPSLSFAVGGAPNELDYWEEIISEFAAGREIDVEILRQPTDTDQRRQGLVIPLNAGERDPDVFLMDVAWVAQFSASDWLLPLGRYIQKDQFSIEHFFRPVIEQVDSYKGQLIALPVYLDCGLLYYRTDLLDKYGFEVPQTWKQLLEISRKVQEKERKLSPKFYGFVWQGAQYEGLICNFMEFITSNGGGIVSGDLPVQNFVVDSPANIKALDFMRDLIHEYKISPPNTFTEMKEEEVRQYFQVGNALFERNWPYALKLHQDGDSPVKDKVGIALLPRFEGGRHAGTLGGWHLGVSRFSDVKGEAWELVKYILSYKTQKRLALNLGWNPGRKDLYTDPDIRDKMPQMKVLKEALEKSVARPSLPYYTRISSILQLYVSSALSDKISPGDALQKAQNEIVKAASSYE